MAAETLTYIGELTVVTCWCGIRHAIPSELRREQQRAHENGRRENVYCPLGHQHAPAGESKAQRLERQLDAARNEAARRAAERDQAEASAKAHKGHATRLRKRAKAGTCPCCKRTFKQLSRHMATQHPDFDPEGTNHDHR